MIKRANYKQISEYHRGSWINSRYNDYNTPKLVNQLNNPNKQHNMQHSDKVPCSFEMKEVLDLNILPSAIIPPNRMEELIYYAIRKNKNVIYEFIEINEQNEVSQQNVNHTNNNSNSENSSNNSKKLNYKSRFRPKKVK